MQLKNNESKILMTQGRNIYYYLIIFLFISPSIIWIILDHRVWPWDQAWYGQVSVELFYTLLNSPSQWISLMLSAFGSKAPGVAWFGQFFVPMGVVFGAIDIGLLLSILITQLLVLIFIFRAIQELSNRKIFISLAGTLVVASAPLFVAMQHQYMVESMQTFAVAWFVHIMIVAPKWTKTTILIQLISATSLAMLAKVSSPLYCIGPSLLALYSLFKHNRQQGNDPNIHSEKSQKIKNGLMVVICILLLVSCLGWYLNNLTYISHYLNLIKSDVDFQLLYGREDTFINKIIFWFLAIRSNFFYSGIFVFYVLCYLAGVFKILVLDRGRKLLDYSNLCSFVCLVQILIITLSLSSNPVEEVRYLLPVVPHLAIIISWSLIQIDKSQKQTLSIFMCLILLIQLFAVHGQSLAIIPINPNVSSWLYSVDRESQNAKTLNQLVDRICTNNERNRYNIIGVELPWLNANSVAYYSAKALESQNIRCYYTSLGHAENKVDQAWKRLLSLNINYYVTLKQNLIEQKLDAFNQVSIPILQKIETSSQFQQGSSLEDSRLLIFKQIR